MPQRSEHCDENVATALATCKQLSDCGAHSSQNENPGEVNVYKRPRGRPKLAKNSLELSDTLSSACDGTDNRDRSLTKLEHCKMKRKTDGVYSPMIECRREVTIVEKRPRGRPKLSKNPASPSQKRGRGRPPRSCNSKYLHSVNENGHSLKDSPTYKNIPKNLNETCAPTSEGSLQNKSSLNAQSFAPSSKRGRGRPAGAKNKPKTLKLQKKTAKKCTKLSIYISKETRTILRKRKALNKKGAASQQTYQPSNVRDIPKHRFEEAITMLTNPEHPIWEERNTSCNKSIHRHWDEYVTAPSDHNLRLKFARRFLMRRDWINLCKVLSISLQDVVTPCNSYYSLFTKYAAICLAHTDKQHFNKFVQFLLKTEDGGKVLKKCTQFSQTCTDEEEV